MLPKMWFTNQFWCFLDDLVRSIVASNLGKIELPSNGKEPVFFDKT